MTDKIIYKYNKTVYPEHDWYKNDDGSIDEFAYNNGYHNGPMCKRCDYSFCMHCEPNGYNKQECIEEKEEYLCPHCNKNLFDILVIIVFKNKIKFCPSCGGRIIWPSIEEIKEIKEK